MLKKEKLAIIRTWYPNAITTIDYVNKLIDFAEDNLEIEPGYIMLADSICSDDVNSIQYPARAQEFLGPFKMGGLDGFPFTGLTGMAAFSSHAPDNGAVLITYGPHVGITKSGTIGEIHRMGQSQNTDCCGASRSALAKLKADKIVPGHITDIDFQMNTIEQILFVQKDRILEANQPLQEATEVIYEAIDARINELVEQTDFHCRFVILVGNVLINSDSDMGSFTSVERFDVINVATKERVNQLDYFQ
jgi:hypothetical protein